jgi:hypothetical protein
MVTLLEISDGHSRAGWDLGKSWLPGLRLFKRRKHTLLPKLHGFKHLAESVLTRLYQRSTVVEMRGKAGRSCENST